jgi:hypothetical protein
MASDNYPKSQSFESNASGLTNQYSATASGSVMYPQFLTIVQDPYPDINCSPDEMFNPSASCISNQMSLSDCIRVDHHEIKQEDTYFFNDHLNLLDPTSEIAEDMT